MKILLINQDWFRNEFRAAGHEAVTCGYAPHLDVVIDQPFIHIDRLIERLPGGFKPDAIILHDNSSPIMVSGLEESALPCIFYSVDTHHHSALHRYLAHIFDHTFVAQKDYMPDFLPLGITPEWMPLWASRLGQMSQEKKFGAVFVGTLDPALNPDRVRFFDELKKHVPVMFRTGDWMDIFPFAEIVINQTVKGDLNFRVFESMGCGPLLLTERSGNGLFELFTDERHLISYEKGNVAQAAELINFYLSNAGKCREIAREGRTEVVAKHLPEHRAARFLEVLSGLKRTCSSIRYWAAQRNYAQVAVSFEKRGEKGLSARALLLSLQAAEKAIGKHETLTQDAALYLVISATLFDQTLGSKEGERILNIAGEAYPEASIVNLARIRTLVAAGQVDEAARIAKIVNPESDVQALFRGAKEVMVSLMTEVVKR